MRELARRTVVITASALAVLAIAAMIYFARWVLLYTAIGVGIGVIFDPAMRFLTSRAKLPRGLGALALLLLWLGMLSSVAYLIYILAATQLPLLTGQIPSVLNSSTRKLGAILERFPPLSEAVGQINWNSIGQGVLKFAAKGIDVGFLAVGFIVYVMVISLYLAPRPEQYQRGILSLFPKQSRSKVRMLLHESAVALRRWFLAQLVAMMCVGAMASIGFLIIGLEAWWALGLLTAVLDIVPFVGPSIAGVCAGIVALGSDPVKVLWVLLNLVIVEYLESKLVLPMVMKKGVDLPPIQLLAFMFILGDWFGILGVLVAPPLLTVVRTVYFFIFEKPPTESNEAFKNVI